MGLYIPIQLYAGAQPGGFLFGLTATQPVTAEVTAGDPSRFGTDSDPMVGKRIGGVAAFGGALATAPLSAGCDSMTNRVAPTFRRGGMISLRRSWGTGTAEVRTSHSRRVMARI
jgi:hypothetical protein